MATPPRGTPADLETLRGCSGRPVCLPGHVSLPVVFLPVRGDPRYRCAGMQLASGLTQICVSPSEPSRTDPVQGQGGRGASPLGGALLAKPDVVSRTDAPRDSPSLANSSEAGSTFSERGHPLAPAPRLVESPRMVLGRDAEVLSGLLPAVVNTIASARALSTRQAYRLKWNLFVDWCSPRREDPRRWPIAVVLSFLQDGLERRPSPSTLKVYVAAIAAHHDAVDGKSLGKHDLVIRFLRGARRLNPLRPHLVPSWDLPSVLSALRGAPFEPLQSVELKFLSLKTVLLSALATVKRVGDLQAFSVDDSCLEFGPADSHVVLRTPAWICAQSSHHALQGPGGELASTAPGGGRPSHCSALSRSCLAHLCGPHAELQDLRPALCLLRRTAEGKSCLQTKTRPLDSGGYSLGLSGPALTVPPWCESTLYERRCFLLGFGARRLNSRHL